MADNAKAAIAASVDEMARDLNATWDSALNWAATTDALVDVIADIGGEVDPIHFATLLGAAAMARRQSFQAPAESEVAL